MNLEGATNELDALIARARETFDAGLLLDIDGDGEIRPKPKPAAAKPAARMVPAVIEERNPQEEEEEEPEEEEEEEPEEENPMRRSVQTPDYDTNEDVDETNEDLDDTNEDVDANEDVDVNELLMKLPMPPRVMPSASISSSSQYVPPPPPAIYATPAYATPAYAAPEYALPSMAPQHVRPPPPPPPPEVLTAPTMPRGAYAQYVAPFVGPPLQQVAPVARASPYINPPPPAVIRADAHPKIRPSSGQTTGCNRVSGGRRRHWEAQLRGQTAKGPHFRQWFLTTFPRPESRQDDDGFLLAFQRDYQDI
jgi:hypothetical protein